MNTNGINWNIPVSDLNLEGARLAALKQLFQNFKPQGVETFVWDFGIYGERFTTDKRIFDDMIVEVRLSARGSKLDGYFQLRTHIAFINDDVGLSFKDFVQDMISAIRKRLYEGNIEEEDIADHHLLGNFLGATDYIPMMISAWEAAELNRELELRAMATRIQEKVAIRRVCRM